MASSSMFLLFSLFISLLLSSALSAEASASRHAPCSSSSSSLPSVRPAPRDRKFNSSVVDRVIDEVKPRFKDRELATLFENTWPCTLDTTVENFTPSTSQSPPDSFVVTGDINAQWLRDSTNQVLPYVPFVRADRKLQELICGLVQRQSRNVLYDPFANAFNYNATSGGRDHQDDTRVPHMTPPVFEGKYELDSLAAALKLSYAYFNATEDSSCFLHDRTWIDAMMAAVKTIKMQQQPTRGPSQSSYLFLRVTSTPTDTLSLGGVGGIGTYTGMSRSAFRPSDDATTFPHFVPANAMAVVELRHLSSMLDSLRMVSTDVIDEHTLLELRDNATVLADEIDAGIRKYGIVPAPRYMIEQLGFDAAAQIFAYEVDGHGSQLLMDDANIPSLLALPYLGYLDVTDPIYQATRAFVLSPGNPFFFNGSVSQSIGSPHTGIDYIWPMSLVARILTSTSDEEISLCLQQLIDSSAGTGWLHESFQKNDAHQFTRTWFAWVNGLFGSAVLKLAKERPYLIFNSSVPFRF